MQVRVYFAAILALIVASAEGAFAQQSLQTGVQMSDRDKAGLRGPVKTVVYERTFSGTDGQPLHTTTTTEYTRDGRILETRTGNADGSEWLTNYTYDRDGRLLRTVSGSGGSTPSSETTYVYDDSQRLVGVRSGDKDKFRYQYDAQGRKSLIESYDSKPLPPSTAYAPHWEGSDLGFAPFPGGTLTTSYNEQDVAIGAQLHDGQGRLVAHIVRKFDSKNRIITEKQVADEPELMIPEAERAKLSPEQAKAMGAFVAGGLLNWSISYSYDAEDRLTEKRRNVGALGQEVTATTYNDHGDKASESTTRVMNPDVGRVFSVTEAGTILPTGQPQSAEPPETYETQYTYHYDGYGNWTEQTTVARSAPGSGSSPLAPANIVRRKLTYY